jgi:hypothetical protein
MFEIEFSETATNSFDKLSLEDNLFLSVVTNGIQTRSDVHYQMPLPLNTDVHLPNNKPMAEKRLVGLKRKMLRNPGYKNDYTDFMGVLIANGYAEPVPPDDVKLDPFIDKDSIIRVGGRMKKSNLPMGQKHPILLPRHSHVTYLIVEHYHRVNAHPGRGMTLDSIRKAGYWIVGARSVVTSNIMKCVSCIKLRGAPLGQKMADLPDDRMNSVAPFAYSAVDYFGPFEIRDKRSNLKRWGVLFTCLASRAIHIETSNSLDTDSFLNAYRRFVCRRGPVRKLRCDRGTNFVGGKNELTAALAEMDKSKITKELLKDNCDLVEFDMNIPHASHMGGVWERMIGCARNALYGLLLRTGHQMDDELLRTLMVEAEVIVNSRPLTFIDTEDPNSPQPLSPSQLLTLKTKVVMSPPGHFVREDLYCRRRWRRVQNLANQFWQQWRTDFLPTLQERKKWTKPQRNVKKDDIVLVIDENQARCDWPLGRVSEIHPSEDGLVRKVEVRVGKKTLERPIHKLVLLLRAETADDSRIDLTSCI